MRPFDK